MTFERLLRLYRFYEALTLYDAYYERMANLGEEHSHLGDALPIAWVPLVFHCTYFRNLDSILNDGVIRPGQDKTFVALTELSVVELTRFRTLRSTPFDVAIGFPRVLLESRGLFQPTYLKHALPEVKNAFKDAPPGYVELNDDLGALHEVRVPGELPIDDCVWVLSARRNEQTKTLDLPEFAGLRKAKIPISYWHPSHQETMIREPVFRLVKRDVNGVIVDIATHGRHYLPDMANHVTRQVSPPHGKAFRLRFPTELRGDTLKNGWEGPYSKYEMANFCFEELKMKFPDRISEIQPRIEM